MPTNPQISAQTHYSVSHYYVPIIVSQEEQKRRSKEKQEDLNRQYFSAHYERKTDKLADVIKKYRQINGVPEQYLRAVERTNHLQEVRNTANTWQRLHQQKQEQSSETQFHMEL